MEQFLSEGPLEYLLALMFIPCIAALLLFGYIAFAVSRRGKKSKMKLGIQSDNAESKIMEPIPTTPPTGQHLPEPNKQSNSGNPDADNLESIPSSASDLDSKFEQSLQAVNLSARLSVAAGEPTPVEPSEREAVPQPTPPQAVAQEPVELMRLLRLPDSGQLML